MLDFDFGEDSIDLTLKAERRFKEIHQWNERHERRVLQSKQKVDSLDSELRRVTECLDDSITQMQKMTEMLRICNEDQFYALPKDYQHVKNMSGVVKREHVKTITEWQGRVLSKEEILSMREDFKSALEAGRNKDAEAVDTAKEVVDGTISDSVDAAASVNADDTIAAPADDTMHPKPVIADSAIEPAAEISDESQNQVASNSEVANETMVEADDLAVDAVAITSSDTEVAVNDSNEVQVDAATEAATDTIIAETPKDTVSRPHQDTVEAVHEPTTVESVAPPAEAAVSVDVIDSPAAPEPHLIVSSLSDELRPPSNCSEITWTSSIVSHCNLFKITQHLSTTSLTPVANLDDSTRGSRRHLLDRMRKPSSRASRASRASITFMSSKYAFIDGRANKHKQRLMISSTSRGPSRPAKSSSSGRLPMNRGTINTPAKPRRWRKFFFGK